MPNFDPTEFHELAGELLSNLSGRAVADSGPDQARVRTAIGRSYYVDALSGENTNLGNKMYRLRLRRNRADYNLNPIGFTLQARQYWLSIASEIITEVGTLP